MTTTSPKDLVASAPGPDQSLALARPVASPIDLIKYHEEVAQLIQASLKEGVDYGVIPGTEKHTLFKPGAERLCLAFGATPRYELVTADFDHDRTNNFNKKKKVWNNAFKGDRSFHLATEDGTSQGLYRYIYKCRLVRADGRILAECEGVCSTMEAKYIDRPRDCENTVIKMAQKRALVGAVLNAFALSNRFTQDMEDAVDVTPEPITVNPPAPPVVLFTGTQEQQQRAAVILRANGVPEDLWEDICDNMTKGKPCTPAALKEATAEVMSEISQM